MKTCQREPSQRAHEIEQVRLDLAQAPRGGQHDREEADGERHHRMFGPMPYLNQTMISGPSATFGIMLRLTSSGMTTISSQRNQENSSAAPMPMTTARI